MQYTTDSGLIVDCFKEGEFIIKEFGFLTPMFTSNNTHSYMVLEGFLINPSSGPIILWLSITVGECPVLNYYCSTDSYSLFIQYNNRTTSQQQLLWRTNYYINYYFYVKQLDQPTDNIEADYI